MVKFGVVCNDVVPCSKFVVTESMIDTLSGAVVVSTGRLVALLGTGVESKVTVAMERASIS